MTTITPTPTSTPTEDRSVADRFLEALSNRDFAAVAACLAPM